MSQGFGPCYQQREEGGGGKKEAVVCSWWATTNLGAGYRESVSAGPCALQSSAVGTKTKQQDHPSRAAPTPTNEITAKKRTICEHKRVVLVVCSKMGHLQREFSADAGLTWMELWTRNRGASGEAQ